MSKVTYNTSDKDEWNARTSYIKPVEVGDLAYGQVFERFLPHNPKFECIEIGAIPGTFLVYFHKQFGYRVTGLDFADNTKVFYDTMAANGITDFDFIQADFLTYKSPKQYDVVTSFGFVEHFDDYPGVIRQHCDMVKPGGYLIITMPNFRYLQYVYHRLFDKPNLDIHNTKVMRPAVLDQIIRDQGFKKLFNGYFGKLDLWRENSPLSARQAWWEAKVRTHAMKLSHRLPVSRLYTPSIILVYQKRAAEPKS